MQIPHSAALDLAGELTLEAWINPATDGAYHAIITKDVSIGATNNTFEFRVDPDRSLQFLQADGTAYYLSASTGGLAAGWRHVAVTKTAAGLVTFYIDGVADSSFAMPNGVATNTRPVYIGGRHDGLTLKGGIDEAAIYSTAHTAAAIAAQAAAGQSRLTGTTVSMAAGTHKVRIDYSLQAGSPASGLELTWAAGTAAPTTVPGSALTPDYGLKTSTTTYDGTAGAGGAKTTAYGYDARGRVASIAYPAYGGAAARTVTYTHAAGGDPLTTSVSDPAGTIATTVDLTGRTVSYTDASGVTAATAYNPAGSASSTAVTVGATTQTISQAYDAAGRPTTQTLNGSTTLSTTSYDGNGQISSVAYANGTGLASIGRDNSGRTTALTWSLTDGGVRDTVTRSQAGDIMTGAVHTGTVVSGALTSPAIAASYTYGYDAASRLIAATAPGHTFSYGFGATACAGVAGASADAGKSTNRTSSTDAHPPIGGGSTTTTTESCYDRADRLLSSTATGAATLTPAYDTHGSTTTLGDQTLGYDAANRHLTTVLAGGGGTVYIRDAADRLISATATPPGGTATTTRYGYTGASDSAAVMLDGSGAYAGITIGLPGGATVTITPAAQKWAYPNIHGSVIATADATGARGAGPIYCYDPFGQPLASATGAIDPDAVPASLVGTLDNGWLGSNQRPYEHTGTIATIEMGHRQYIPALGRFIEIDPVRGGSANDYDYVGADPINGYDLNGLEPWNDGHVKGQRCGYGYYANCSCVQGPIIQSRLAPSNTVNGQAYRSCGNVFRTDSICTGRYYPVPKRSPVKNQWSLNANHVGYIVNGGGAAVSCAVGASTGVMLTSFIAFTGAPVAGAVFGCLISGLGTWFSGLNALGS